MSKEFDIEIISPDNNILSTKAEEIILPCFEGQVTILKDHISLITFLRPGFVIIKGENEKKFFVEDGTVEFTNNNLLILTSTATDTSNMSKTSIESLIYESEKKLKDHEISDKERYLLSYKLESLKNINL